ncbi:hypothetical protein AF60_00330 [Streptococcus uberis S6261]|nr:hypothetical protein AF61_09400 [Streptococcus uberis EF20/0145]KKF48542.1 hypothetical protein AF59_09575 [Streptococcus uberis C5072]KKF48829.1 hypothetical protein AF60_00330 [Streptococcus uberis S6261]KKF49623.1 hypothetical protein AF62_07055 [Streptococcus uberis C8329]KKF58130.1 hypothetical protein AF69_05095 [Streptococcus uberis 6736]KKF61656.1 hypothetical protein AF58_09410 [Streptococcus uberis C6344]
MLYQELVHRGRNEHALEKADYQLSKNLTIIRPTEAPSETKNAKKFQNIKKK